MDDYRFYSIFCLLGSLFLACAQAQNLPGDRDLARDRQQRLLQEQQQRLDELQSLPGFLPDTSSDLLSDDAPCVQVRRI